MKMDELLAEFACLDPVYVDGIAGLLNLGTNFGLLFYRWQPVASDHGGVILQRTPALQVVAPRSAIVRCNEGCGFDKLVEHGSAPIDQVVRSVAGTH